MLLFRLHYLAAAVGNDRLECGTVFPGFEFVGAEETAAGAGEAPVRDTLEAR